MIKIICIGKIKETYLREAIEEYKKRISKYTQLEIIELEDYSFQDNKITLKKEKERLYNYIRNRRKTNDFRRICKQN